MTGKRTLLIIKIVHICEFFPSLIYYIWKRSRQFNLSKYAQIKKTKCARMANFHNTFLSIFVYHRLCAKTTYVLIWVGYIFEKKGINSLVSLFFLLHCLRKSYRIRWLSRSNYSYRWINSDFFLYNGKLCILFKWTKKAHTLLWYTGVAYRRYNYTSTSPIIISIHFIL